MMPKLTNENYLEVYLILNKLGEGYINRIPKKLYNLIKEKAVKGQKNNKDISKESIVFIAMLHYNYWCDSEAEKQEIISVLKENEASYEQELREKYKVNVFEKNQVEPITKNESESTELVAIHNEKWIFKIINFIKNIFKRRRLK